MWNAYDWCWKSLPQGMIICIIMSISLIIGWKWSFFQYWVLVLLLAKSENYVVWYFMLYSLHSSSVLRFYCSILFSILLSSLLSSRILTSYKSYQFTLRYDNIQCCCSSSLNDGPWLLFFSLPPFTLLFSPTFSASLLYPPLLFFLLLSTPLLSLLLFSLLLASTVHSMSSSIVARSWFIPYPRLS